MAFQEIKPVDSADDLIDIAIRRANKRAAKIQKGRESQLDHVKNKEISRILSIREEMVSRLNELINQFPDPEELTDFYKEMVKITIGEEKMSRQARSLVWARDQIKELFREYVRKMKTASEMAEVNKVKRAYYGRVSSVVKQLELDKLEKIRKKLQGFPVIKTRFNQVAIAGFPNVGKSTLLSKMSGSTPEIAGYAFTTKGIMIGYFDKVQLLDTPGTLNRFNKMNYIEQQAFLVMKLVAEKIIYVFDLTEPYPLEDQVMLYNRIKELGKPVLVYLSKTDILEEEKIKEFKKKYKDAVCDADKLKEKLADKE